MLRRAEEQEVQPMDVVEINTLATKKSANGESNRVTLRRFTRTQHDRAELHWTNTGAFTNIDRYRVFLGSMSSIHRTLGFTASANNIGHSTEFEDARVLALHSDLGVSAEPERFPNSLPMTSDFAWGVLYVLNGSAMGASTLLKSKVIDPSWPTAYLRTMQYFVRSGALAAFFRSLNSIPLDTTQAVMGARAVFDAISEAHLIDGELNHG
ncbi:MAG: hypothetical protein AB8B85_03150 [Paracoccaceae bacterium]